MTLSPLKLSLVAAAGALTLAAPAFAASPLLGEWNTPEKHGVVRIYQCGEALCGKVETGDDIKADPNLTDQKNKDAAQRTRPMKGLVIFSGLTGGPKDYNGASLYNPTDGNTYHGSMKVVDDNTVKLTGCIVFPLCKTQVWHRASL